MKDRGWPEARSRCALLLKTTRRGRKAKSPAMLVVLPPARTPKDFRAAAQVGGAEQGTMPSRDKQDNHWRQTKLWGTRRVPGCPAPCTQARQTTGGSQQSHSRRRKRAATKGSARPPLHRDSRETAKSVHGTTVCRSSAKPDCKS